MALIFDLSSRITLDTDTFKSKLDVARRDFTNAAKHLERTTYKIGRTFSTLGSSLTRMAIAPAALIALSSRAFAKQQDAVLQLQAALESTTGASGQTIESLSAMATALQRTTRFGDEEVMSAQGLLLTFTNLTSVFPRATAMVLDMSTALKQDLKSSAIQLGKALNDPILGVTALRRVGVQLTEQQEAQVKAFVKSNDILGAQNVIMTELERQVGGSARKAAEGFGGAMDQAKNIVGDLAEVLGASFAPTLTVIARRISEITPAIIKWVEQHPKLTAAIGGTVVVGTALLATLAALATSIGMTAFALNGLAKFMAIGYVKSMLVAAKANGVFAVSLGPLAVALGLLAVAFALVVDKPLRDYVRTMPIAQMWTDKLYLSVMSVMNVITTGVAQAVDSIGFLITALAQAKAELLTFGKADTDLFGTTRDFVKRAGERGREFVDKEKSYFSATGFSPEGRAARQADREQARDAFSSTDAGLAPAIRDLMDFLKSESRKRNPSNALNPGAF